MNHRKVFTMYTHSLMPWLRVRSEAVVVTDHKRTSWKVMSLRFVSPDCSSIFRDSCLKIIHIDGWVGAVLRSFLHFLTSYFCQAKQNIKIKSASQKGKTDSSNWKRVMRDEVEDIKLESGYVFCWVRSPRADKDVVGGCISLWALARQYLVSQLMLITWLLSLWRSSILRWALTFDTTTVLEVVVMVFLWTLFDKRGWGMYCHLS